MCTADFAELVALGMGGAGDRTKDVIPSRVSRSILVKLLYERRGHIGVNSAVPLIARGWSDGGAE